MKNQGKLSLTKFEFTKNFLFLYRTSNQTRILDADMLLPLPLNCFIVNNLFLDMNPEKALDSDAADFREKANELFEKGEDKEVEDVVNELCEKGIITSKMTTFNLYNNDGTLKSSTPARILVIRDADRVNEVVNFHCLFSGCA